MPTKKKEKKEDPRIQIRSSSLGAIAGCIRHFAAGREPDNVIKAHPDVAKATASKGGGYRTWFGTGFHKAMEDNVKDSKKIRKICRDTLKEASSNEGFWDEKFQKMEQLEELMEQMVHAFRKSKHSEEWTLKRRGNKYEQALESKEIDGGILLTGHIDCIRKDGMALDLKTGVTDDRTLHQEQLTAYRMLIEHNGMKSTPHAEVVKVLRPKTPNFRTPISSKRYRIDTRPHEQRVIRLVKEAADVVAYRERWADDFTKLPANPASRACVYCELKGTSACPETTRMEV